MKCFAVEEISRNIFKSALELLMIHIQSDPSAVSTENAHFKEHREKYTRNMDSSDMMKDDQTKKQCHRRRSDKNINKIVRYTEYSRKSKDFVFPSIQSRYRACKSVQQEPMDRLFMS